MEDIALFVEFVLWSRILEEAVELYMVVEIVIRKEDLSIRGILAKLSLLYPAMTADAIKAKTSPIYYPVFQF